LLFLLPFELSDPRVSLLSEGLGIGGPLVFTGLVFSPQLLKFLMESSLSVKKLDLVLICEGVYAGVSIRSYLGQLSLILMCYLGKLGIVVIGSIG